ncbi:methyl-accepting chemotaxis protein [Roseospirillum parvum]|uniref:Methyl-accepting chemotaxis protein n=1 Tax=Roseospirillum parvum TaxID=83401 RepID=A0A1G7ZEQ7_9PROT|nr:methyl-accepting chemotaxis protein [Roseospirillum parvum]SDH07178.1 methyl-accepting chemotaxis protein [Roseospirillum parvum]
MLRNLPILWRIGLAMVVLSALTAVVQAVPGAWVRGEIIRGALSRELNGHYENLIAAIRAEADKARTLSALVAGIPEVRAAFAAGDRDRLGALFVPGFAALKADHAVVQFQFHVPPATSFLRVHKPEKFGDDLSGFRLTVLEANREQAPRSGIEKGVAGLGVRGMVPVAHDGAHVGTVEFGMSFGQPFLDSFKADFGVDVALHLAGEEGFSVFASTLDGPSQLSGEALAAALAGTPSLVEHGRQAVLARSIRDFAGQPIGVVELVLDSSAYAAQAAAGNRNALLFGAVAVLVASLLGLLIARGISRPIRAMTQGMERLTRRDFAVDIAGQQRRDEIGLMARALSVFKDAAIEMDASERRMGQRVAELETREAQVKAETQAHLEGVVAAAVEANQAITVLARMTRELRATNARSQSMASAVEELVASVKEIAGNSDTAAGAAQEAGGQAGEGLAGARRAVDSMAAIHRAVSQAAATVDALSRASAEIGVIIQEIEDIASQTNLLALNATIEAARAGDAGKGFAVVAGEVKALAGQTAKATDDIRGRIDHLRREMETIVGAMNQGATAVDQGREVVNGLGDQLTGISGAINDVTGRMQEIAAILGQQTAAANEVSAGTGSIAQMVRRNSDEVDEVLAAMDKANAVLEARVAEFAKVGTARAIVEVAKNDHMVFARHVVETVIGRQSWREADMPSHLTCRFGKWYAAVDDPRIKGNPAFTQLVEPHRAVHDKGKEAVRLAAQGDLDGAMAAAEAMHTASLKVVARLTELARGLD